MANTHDILAQVVERLKCKPGWSFRLQPGEDEHPELIVRVPGYDSAAASSTDQLIRAAEQLDRECRDAPTFPNREIAEAIGKLRGAFNQHRRLTVDHHFPVPYATYNENAWRRWIFECCHGVENHELGEWFRDGSERPFAPLHGPGELPYVVHEFRPETDAITMQDGSLREPYK